MIEIKRLAATDAHLATSLFDQYRVFYRQASNLLLAEKFIEERLQKNESIIFVAMAGKVPAGFTQLYPIYSSVKANKNWILNDLYVKEDFRKQSIGEKLIKAAMDFAKNDGATFVQLETAKDNSTAQRLYETIGFKKQLSDEDFFTYRIELC